MLAGSRCWVEAGEGCRGRYAEVDWGIMKGCGGARGVIGARGKSTTCKILEPHFSAGAPVTQVAKQPCAAQLAKEQRKCIFARSFFFINSFGRRIYGR